MLAPLSQWFPPEVSDDLVLFSETSYVVSPLRQQPQDVVE